MNLRHVIKLERGPLGLGWRVRLTSGETLADVTTRWVLTKAGAQRLALSLAHAFDVWEVR